MNTRMLMAVFAILAAVSLITATGMAGTVFAKSGSVKACEKIAIRYLESLDHPYAKEIYRRVKNGDSSISEIFPSYYLTWDYSKTVTTG